MIVLHRQVTARTIVLRQLVRVSIVLRDFSPVSTVASAFCRRCGRSGDFAGASKAYGSGRRPLTAPKSGKENHHGPRAFHAIGRVGKTLFFLNFWRVNDIKNASVDDDAGNKNEATIYRDFRARMTCAVEGFPSNLASANPFDRSRESVSSISLPLLLMGLGSQSGACFE
jgi:hypothetical protein